jgi:folylpolyglutamate synthase/dihydropteroate synthase
MPLASGDPLDYLFGLEQFGIKFGLDNITALVEALGRPDRAFRSVHVAGTNAKGSVTAMVDHGLRAAGHRTGRAVRHQWHTRGSGALARRDRPRA